MNKFSCLAILAVILILTSVQSAPPKLENTFETKTVVEGSKAWILCSATNDLPIKYQWYNQNGDSVTSFEGSSVHVSVAKDGSRLIFEKVNKSQEGIYTCTAENQHGLVSKLFQIIVNSGNLKGNETFSVDEVHVLKDTDSSVEFLVRASMPVIKYTIKYSEKLSPKENIQQFSEGEKILLDGLIPSGLYTFKFQVVFSEGTVSEWSKPQEVVLLPYTPEMVLRSLTKNSLQIEWSQKFDDFRRSTIDGYSLSYGIARRASYDTWEPISCFINIEIPGSCAGSQHTISALTKNSYYEIHLRAHTKAGYGKPAVTKIYVA